VGFSCPPLLVGEGLGVGYTRGSEYIKTLREKFNLAFDKEHSKTLRIIILIAMLIPLWVIARMTNMWLSVFLAGMGIAIGHWYSYRYLEKKHIVIRIGLFVAIHIAFGAMLVGLVIGASFPQVQFAIFSQAITSFDLRYRRSLFNTLLHSLANLYVAASLSRTYEFGLYLIAFAVLVLIAYFIAEREDGFKSAKLIPKRVQSQLRNQNHLAENNKKWNIGMFIAGFGIITFMAIFVIFLFTPRFVGRPIIPAFSFNMPLRGGTKSEIINPGVPLIQINGWSDDTSDYYYGFSTDLDLRYRGGLSDDIVMYVRSPNRSYWRSHSYDTYTGERWIQGNETVFNLRRGGGFHFQLPRPIGSPVKTAYQHPSTWGDRLTQTFMIVRDQPNLIFTAYRPHEVFIASERLSIHVSGSLRLPQALRAGTTYSVVSYRPEFDPAVLRQNSMNYPNIVIERYLPLPDNISVRVKNLAKTLTKPHDTNYDKIIALNNHLRTEYLYNPFPPPHPVGAEVVDNFLFVDKEGVCEQYVTALVVMARTLGIPARLVTGYGTGDYNRLTGYYQVRMNDAHAWAEMYFPEMGWVPFDPTPGWIPEPYPTPIQRWFFSDFGDQLPQFELYISPIVSGMMGLSAIGSIVVTAFIIVGIIAVLIFLIRQLSWSKKQDSYCYSSVGNETSRKIIWKLYRRAMRFLVRKKYRPRLESETLTEYANTLEDMPALKKLTKAAEIAIYRPMPPDNATVDSAQEALSFLKKK